MSKPATILRPDVIGKLRTGALDGMMSQAANTSRDEVYTASLVLATEFVKMAVANKDDLEVIRSMIGQMYSELPPVTVN